LSVASTISRFSVSRDDLVRERFGRLTENVAQVKEEFKPLNEGREQ
jgi:hypothetical protein